MKLLFATLFSGSSGNAVYISCGDEAILIDAGKNCRALERAAAVLDYAPLAARACAPRAVTEHEGYTAAEIGRMMGAPSNTVLSWLRRARAQLHTMLKEEIEDEVV